MGSVCCHPFFIAPVAGEGEAMEAIRDIAIGCLKFLRRHMAMVDMGNLVCVESSSQMAGHLMGTQMGSVGKNGEQLPFPGIWRLGFVARERPKMASKAGD